MEENHDGGFGGGGGGEIATHLGAGGGGGYKEETHQGQIGINLSVKVRVDSPTTQELIRIITA